MFILGRFIKNLHLGQKKKKVEIEQNLASFENAAWHN